MRNYKKMGSRRKSAVKRRPVGKIKPPGKTSPVRVKKPPGKGSLTIFAALTFWLVAQLLFTLAEGCRFTELKKTAEMVSDSAVESMMADYCRPMWETYSLLCYDAAGTSSTVSTARMTGCLESTITADFLTGSSMVGKTYTNLLTLSCENICFDSYTLLTDGNGSAYIKSVASYMEKNLAYEAARNITNNYDSVNTLKKGNTFSFDSIKNVWNSLQKSRESGDTTTCPVPRLAPAQSSTAQSSTAQLSTAQSSTAQSSATQNSSAGSGSSTSSENILQQAIKSKNTGILKQVMPAGKTVSSKTITASGLVSGRNLEKGVSPENGSVSLTDRAFLEAYLLENLNDFTDASVTSSGTTSAKQRALDYELEYILSGKLSDEENLKAAVTEILVVREAANILYLQTSATRKGELKAAAAALSAAAMVPELEGAAEAGLMAAWAYAESLMDLRTLLAGGKIPLMKSDATWSSKLSNLVSIMKGGAKAKSVDSGIGYQDYLGILILAKSNSTLAYRSMDVQEAAIRKTDYYEDFRMDHAVCAVKASFSYSAEPLFFSFIDLISMGSSSFTINAKADFSFRGS